MKIKNDFAFVVFLISLTGCAGYKTFYNQKEKDWDTKKMPDILVKYSVYLIGDAGEPIGPRPGALITLQQNIENADDNHTVIFLGDNVYPKGLPPENGPARDSAEEKINKQLDIFKNDKGKVFFIPGNHDWNNGKNDGLKYALEEEKYIEKRLNKGNVFLPDGGCPGPVEIKLTDDLILVLLNTQGWLQRNREMSNTDDCDVKTGIDWVNEIRNILSDNQRKNLLIVGHHPIYSVGNHGGFYSWKQHIFPLTDLISGLYLPLPVIGSLYPWYRTDFGTKQDLVDPAYERMRENLLAAFSGFNNIIYAAGHEHNLQYFKENDSHFIVSGSGCKTTPVAGNNKASFADADPGFVKLNYLQNGEVWMEVIVNDTANPKGKVVYRKRLKDNVYGDDKDTTDISRPVHYADSTITIAADPKVKTGGFRKFFLGKHYRSAWTTPVVIPLLDLATEQGGLEIIGEGGGMQTKSLRLRNPKGEEFSLRSVTKYPDKLLPENMLKTFVADIVRDQTTSSHPYAAFVVDDLSEAAGILHANPKLVYIPDDRNLAEFKKDFSNQLALFEQRAEGNVSQIENFGNTKEAINSPKMFKRKMQDNENVVDEYALVKCRLFDMWINDWDRHEDQWRWATIRCNKKNSAYCKQIKAGNEYYIPIPRDRDQAFAKFDGVLPWLAGRKWTGRKFQTMDNDFRDIAGFNFNARNLDHSLLTGLSLDDWLLAAQELKQQLSDEKIEHAIRQWPDTIYKLDGPEIISKLKSRRDKLSSFAERYYLFLAEQVDVTGSDKKEIFEVNRMNDKETSVKVYGSKNGEQGRLLYERVFKTGETKEIRLYGLGGDDVFNISGKVNKGILIRVIGGKGNDEITDDSYVTGWCKKTKVYDDKDKNKLHLGSEAKDLTSDSKDINEYDRLSFEYDLLAPAAFFGYNADDGLFLGGGLLIKHNGFRKKPYASLQRIVANVAIHGGSFNFKYKGDFTNLFGKWGLNADFLVLAPKSNTNFYGFGNETTKQLGGSSLFYRVRYDQVYASPSLKREIGKFNSIKMGPVYEYIKIENAPGRFISSADALQYISDFSARNYGGLKLEYEFKNVDDSIMPVRGISWYIGATSWQEFKRSHLHPTDIRGQLSIYIPLPNYSTLALRAGGSTLVNDFEFVQANTLGGVSKDRESGNLRGYLRERYSGRSVAYINTDLRIKLFNFRTYLFPAKFGILGFYDQGKVWIDNATSGTWHTGYGGGIWINPMERAVINATYAISKEEKLYTVSLGFLF